MAGAIVFSIIRWMSHANYALPLKKTSTQEDHATKSEIEPSDFQGDMAKLEKTLFKIQAVLADAEEREIREESVKLWLRELKDVAYDAEDVLHEYEYELLRARVENEDVLGHSTGKRKREETSNFFDFSDRIKDIRMRFEEVEKEHKALRLKEDDGERRVDITMQPLASTQLVDESTVVGREGDVDQLVEMLLAEGSFSVIPVVGMGGLGKTTLARLVLKDPRIARYFNLKVWLSVSMDFDAVKLMRLMIQSITGESCEPTEVSELQDVLKEELKGKRLFLVLDDVWNEDVSVWDCFRLGLIGGGQRKIIVTTRNESAAKIMQTVSPYRLSCLDEDQCRLLFKQCAFGGQDPEVVSPNLVEIGKKIVEKCGGLPLAVKTLGGLLRCEVSEERWEDILVSDLWDLDEGDDDILPALKVSYHRMPAFLKPCFTYCSLFPKNYMFKKDQLVRLWMAQGLIQHEDIGSRYFDDLLRRSFFQHSQVDEDELPLYRTQLWLTQVGREELLQKWMVILANNGDDQTFLMHDLIHDLAQSISGNECCMFEEEKVQEINSKTRHLTVIPKDMKMEDSFHALNELKFLRTFLGVNTKMHTWNGGGILMEESLLYVKVPNDLFMKLRCLRVIDFSFSRIKELPETIGQLKHLRHLGLQACIIKRVPESISNLYFLQTLDLKYCKSLKELPKGIVKLFNLRHLELPAMNLASSVSIPSGIGKLTSLQTLTGINIGKGKGGCSVGELKELVNLRGHLVISGIENVSKAKDANEANLKNKEQLQTLALIWNASDSNAVKVFVANGVFESLQPHTNLQNLSVRGFSGDHFASWLGDPSFSGLTSINLSNCSKCTVLPPLGQLPFLKDLLVGNMKGIRSIGPEFQGHGSASSKAFQALEYLDFEQMPEWEEWDGVVDGDFPKLRRLVIKQCLKLKALPQHSPSLEILEMQDVEMLCSMPTFSSLKSLDLQGKLNDKLLSFTSFQNLHTLEISWSENLTTLQFHGELHALKNLDIGDCPELTTVLGLKELMSLEKLEMNALPKLQFSPGDWLPPTLHSLKVVSCYDLSWLPLHHHLPALKELLITNCPQLAGLEGLQNLSSMENLQISTCEKLFLPLDEALPSTLKSFKLDGCHNLKSIPVFHEKLSELSELVIENCERLTSVAGLHNLTSLETLEISNCSDLQLLPNEALPSSTLEVEIVDCPGLIEWCGRHGIKHSETEDFEIAELDEDNSVGEEEEEDEEEKWYEAEPGTDIEIE